MSNHLWEVVVLVRRGPRLLVCLLLLLRRRLGGIDGRRVVGTHLRLLVAGAVAGGAGLGVARAVDAGAAGSRLEALPGLALTGAVVVLVYLLALLPLRVKEVAPLLARVGLRRRSRAAAAPRG